MADEITITMTANVANGSFKDSFRPGRLQVDQAAIGGDGGVRSIGTSEETVSFTDITTEGYCFIHNLDTTNYVTYGPDDTGMVAFGKLKAGEFAVLRLDATATLVMQANTSACKVLIRVWED